MTIEGHADLDAAERALRSAYQQITERCQPVLSGLKIEAAPTVVHIMPKGRRVESGWYRMGTWADKTDALVESLDFEEHEATPSRDEVFIAGEALALPPREIVNLLFHQWVHQAAHDESTNTYHGNGFKMTAHRLGVWDVERHPTQGWVQFDYGTQVDEVLRDIASHLDRSAFDLYRHPEAERKGSGKMKLWKCQCRRKAPSIYTGAILHARCERCMQPFRYAHKDRHDPAVAQRIWDAGEEVME